MTRIIMSSALAAVLALLAACASFPLTAKGECANRGTPEGHPGYQQCRTDIAREIQTPNTSADLVTAAILAGAIGHGYADARTERIVREGYYGDGASVRICPDGSYVYGSMCYIAPDGTYHAGSTQIAPDGSYVSGGSPRMAPDGSYVGGSGNIIICPDGSYATGQHCSIAPDGSYVGVP